MSEEQLNSNQPIFFEIKEFSSGKKHRMFITKNLRELKDKVKKTYELKENIKEFYYYDKNRKDKDEIYLKTEEDYQIMMMLLNNEKMIYLGFDCES